MVRKKLFAMAMAGMMAVGCLTTPVMAANTKDTKFEFSVTTNYKYTEAREKTDTSSTYVNLKTIPSVYVHCSVQGYRYSSTAGKSAWVNETLGDGEVALRLGQWRIRQNVYEHGGRSARLAFKGIPSRDGLVSGVWSPDCAGSYTYAN